ncbi:uncharacterized protein Tco025E_00371 [Trypanosoma conorhini]|uniref:Uncharacterized protein n=1 Tax=Trypanosoma conorhini TaxID=83891 RepID=A0A3R7SB26_9TRYP|nr:uncharacterized protein Tco025E_00371 [Trypanosoma conorhini]RNF27373.1 hypothetical protein Tco025E_00371 [Trypanosoma conorhini]
MYALNPSLLPLGSSSDLTNFPLASRRGSNSFSAPFLVSEDDAHAQSTTLFGSTAETAASVSLQPSTTEAVAELMRRFVEENRRLKGLPVPAATPSQATDALHFSSAADAGVRKGKLAAKPSGKPLMKAKPTSAVPPQRRLSPTSRPVSRQHSARGSASLLATLAKKQQQPCGLSHGTRSTMSNTGRGLSVPSKTRAASLKEGYFAGGGPRKSFIESITLCEDDTWLPFSGVKKARRKRPATKSAPAPKPPPRQLARQQYDEDATPFAGGRVASSSSRPSPQKLSLAGVRASWDRMGEVDAFGAASHPRALSLSRRDGAIGVSSRALKVPRMSSRSLHAWNETPSNVVLPNGTLPSQERPEESEEVQCDIWRTASEQVEDDTEKGGWMRPLQEVGRAERRATHDAGGGGKLYTRGMDDAEDDDDDDDYHALFHALQRLRPRHHRLIDVLNESTTRTTSGNVRGFTNSFAACSALLKEPQQLLDSRFFRSTTTAAAASLSSGDPGRVASFALGITGVPLFETPEKRPQFVELSPPAKVLYAAVLYLRALGGFPTLLRVNPLSTDSGVVGKEHCVELVFCPLLRPQAEQSAPSGPPQTTRLRYSSMVNSIMAARHTSGGGSQGEGVGREERTVIVRSVLAEKSVVERFGKAEVVHVLPPMYDEKAPFGGGADSTTRKELLEAKSDAVRHLLSDAEPRRGSTVRSRVARSAASTRGVGYGGRSQHADYGDLAVAFLMSGGLSSLSDVPPEPMELEALRYKVYALRHQELADATKKEDVGAAGPQRFAQQQRAQRGSVGLSLLAGEAQPSSPPGKERTASKTPAERTRGEVAKAEAMRRRFPAYAPVTVAESTLATITGRGAAVGVDDPQVGAYEGPHFYKLRLPRLYTDIVDAVQLALDVQDRLKTENVARARFF